ncbi:hypothetical protein D9M68_893940 [compost metagenome]
MLNQTCILRSVPSAAAMIDQLLCGGSLSRSISIVPDARSSASGESRSMARSRTLNLFEVTTGSMTGL